MLLNKYLSRNICNADCMYCIFHIKLFIPVWNRLTRPAPPGIFPPSAPLLNSVISATGNCSFVNRLTRWKRNVQLKIFSTKFLNFSFITNDSRQNNPGDITIHLCVSKPI